jgi:hypothetical protein
MRRMFVVMMRMFRFMGIVFVRVAVVVLMAVLMRMPAFMVMHVGMFVHAVVVTMRVRMFVRVGAGFGVVVGNLGSGSWILVRKNVYFRCGNTAAAHFAHLETRAHVQRRSRVGKRVEGDTRIHKGA